MAKRWSSVEAAHRIWGHAYIKISSFTVFSISQVVVCESHNIPGGAAHAWVKSGYHFESGPSLYSGMASRQESSKSRQ